MATQKCQDCGKQVSKRAKQCPHCGAPAKRKSGCLGVVGLLILTAAIVSVIATSVQHKQPPPPAETRHKTPAPAAEPKTPAPKPQPEQAKPEPKAQPGPAAPDWAARQSALEAQFLPEFQAPVVGTRISLTLKGGGTQEGIVKSLSDDEIQIERNSATLGFTKNQLAAASRARCFSADYATYKAHMQTKQERDEFEEQERVKQAKLEAQRKAAQEARFVAEREKRIQSAFSPWDGSHRGLARAIKSLMNDPKSYDHDETVWSDQGDHLIVRTSFRGKNAFGAVVINWVRAKCDLDGNVIEIIEQGP